jgi:hypothetical protein
LREMEDTKVLSKDGASAEILEHALLPLSQAVHVHWGYHKGVSPSLLFSPVGTTNSCCL